MEQPTQKSALDARILKHIRHGGAQEVREALAAAVSLAAEHARLAAALKGKWRAAVKELPLESLLADWRQACDRWFLPRLSGQRVVRARLAPAADGTVP